MASIFLCGYIPVKECTTPGDYERDPCRGNTVYDHDQSVSTIQMGSQIWPTRIRPPVEHHVVHLDDPAVGVEVADADTRPPTARTVTVDSTEGRGLGIVSVLAVRWGWCPRRHGIGKAVWAEVQLPAASTDELTPEFPGAPTSDAQAAGLTPDA
ncbi:hypothetical protein GCM10009535_26240 [Streptomyces thermocarboxydovorans]|uniref:ATP-binding protein n=1 Tax=Streptomyces thermocarboxydovorans TaxID=59298 RepID=A0ABN1HH57_9ACTN